MAAYRAIALASLVLCAVGATEHRRVLANWGGPRKHGFLADLAQQNVALPDECLLAAQRYDGGQIKQR